jgi:molecular chaperone HtpG
VGRASALESAEDASAEDTSMNEASAKETLGFQAEVQQLLHLMIHSLYGNKEIFLRELISNASDACDRLRFDAIADGGLLEDDPDLEVRVSYDRNAGTITVSDNGIGMSRQEVIDHIGTIAKSGTREFFETLTADRAGSAQLIGQFGVGFYASFIVADTVTIETRRAGLPPGDDADGVRWESRGEGEYTIEPARKATRGTVVTLHLRAGEGDLLNGSALREILRKYSDHISIPILMKKEQWDANAREQVLLEEDEQINQASALWARPKAEITEEQYHEFYKHVAHDFEPPLAYSHAKVEGRQEYTQLLFIPQRAPYDLWSRDHRRGIKLYVRRVFIMDDAEQLMPAYLRFVRGVIDSGDLPLNVSREILQQSRDVETIRAASVKRVLGLLEDLAGHHGEKYATFWQEFGAAFKEGVVEDAGNRARIAKLLRFASTHSDLEQQTVALSEYVSRMKEGQAAIYYITGEGFPAARNSPHLELFRKIGVEVLLLYDRVDEWVASTLTEFEGKPLQSVARGDLDLGKLDHADGEQAQQKQQEDEYKDLVERIQGVLKERTGSVRVTRRLTDSPACLVSAEHGISLHLERLLKAAGQQVPAVKPVLEINPRHPIVRRLKDEPESGRFADWSHILFDQATLAEGGQLEDPAAFVKRLNDLMVTLAGGPASPVHAVDEA